MAWVEFQKRFFQELLGLPVSSGYNLSRRFELGCHTLDIVRFDNASGVLCNLLYFFDRKVVLCEAFKLEVFHTRFV
jgi:hypothetical protein